MPLLSVPRQQQSTELLPPRTGDIRLWIDASRARDISEALSERVNQADNRAVAWTTADVPTRLDQGTANDRPDIGVWPGTNSFNGNQVMSFDTQSKSSKMHLDTTDNPTLDLFDTTAQPPFAIAVMMAASGYTPAKRHAVLKIYNSGGAGSFVELGQEAGATPYPYVYMQDHAATQVADDRGGTAIATRGTSYVLSTDSDGDVLEGWLGREKITWNTASADSLDISTGDNYNAAAIQLAAGSGSDAGTQNFRGAVAEAIVWSGGLSADELNMLWAYFDERWQPDDNT